MNRTGKKQMLLAPLLGVVVGVLVPVYELGKLAVLIHLGLLPLFLMLSLQKFGSGMKGIGLRLLVSLFSILLFALVRSHMYSWSAYSNHRGFWGIDGESQMIVLATGFVQIIALIILGFFIWISGRANSADADQAKT